jgi:TonB family protein
MTLTRRLWPGVGVALLTACTTSSINTDAPQRANAQLEQSDRDGVPTPTRYADQSARLWNDKPQYAALVGVKPLKNMRMISAAAPAYPTMLRLAHINARVVVSFVVGTDGRVEEARVIESSDSRFNDSALEAMRNFTFLPAQGPSGPVRQIEIQPFNFWWSEKAHPAP